jgi:hypothetical protein
MPGESPGGANDVRVAAGDPIHVVEKRTPALDYVEADAPIRPPGRSHLRPSVREAE